MDPRNQEVENLKKQNQDLNERLSKVELQVAKLCEKDLLNDHPIPVVNNQLEGQEQSKTDTVGIVFIVVGAVLCFTMVGAILGLPLLIWGIVRLVKSRKVSVPETSVAVPVSSASVPSADDYLPVQDEAKASGSKTQSESVLAPAQEKMRFEEKMGIKWMAWAGMITLVFGIGFFIRYAIENNWIDYTTRIVLGALSGIVLVAIGHFMKKKEKYSVLGQVMIGGGFALTYFSVYAAYHFSEYRHAIGISQVTDIVLLTIVSVFAVLYSVRENSRAITIGAFFLGFITTLLGNDFEILTLIYGLILALGLLAVVYIKGWSELAIGGVVATYFTYITWETNLDMDVRSFEIAAIFLILYYLVFNFHALLLSIKEKQGIGKLVVTTLLNAFFFTTLFWEQLMEYYPNLDALFLVVLGIVNLIMFFVIFQVGEKNKLSHIKLSLAIFYITLAVPAQFDDQWVTIIWVIEAAVLVLLSLNPKARLLLVAAYLLSLVIFLKVFFIDSFELNEFSIKAILESDRFFAFISAIVFFYCMKALLVGEERKAQKQLKQAEENSKTDQVIEVNQSEFKTYLPPSMYSWGASILAVMLIGLEMEDYWISVGWAVLGITILAVGFIYKRRQLRYQGIAIFMLTLLKVFLYDTLELDTIYRTISFMVLGVILLLASFAYAKYKDEIKKVL